MTTQADLIARRKMRELQALIKKFAIETNELIPPFHTLDVAIVTVTNRGRIVAAKFNGHIIVNEDIPE